MPAALLFFFRNANDSMQIATIGNEKVLELEDKSLRGELTMAEAFMENIKII